jgi:hypothetical protein
MQPTSEEAPDPKRAEARRRGKRLTTAIYGTFATAFVVLSTYQIAVGVFGVRAAPLDAARAGDAPDAPDARRSECIDGVRALAAALDRATAGATSAPDEASALASFRAALSPEWDNAHAIESRCGADPHTTDAFATLRRLRLADETAVRRQGADLAPLRRELATYLTR